jgi:redox-sensing transcriptional repressor
MERKPIPDIVVGRLPIYLRALQRMAEDNQRLTSSQELSDHLGISAAQIRKDLSQFGEFGKQGTGYNIDFLVAQLRQIFDIDQGKIGTQVGPFVVQDYATMSASISQAGIRVAMIAVPAISAQAVADELINAGIKAILNYAPININVPEGIYVQHTDPVTHLQRMTYYLE